MKIVKFQDVKESIISNMRRSMLIPIIGSGFTRNCQSYNGVVPSGEDYRRYMLEEISEAVSLSSTEEERLKAAPFSAVSEVYYESGKISLERQRSYLRNHFTQVQIEENKQEFLSLPWPYVYTLNIDDGIEQGSIFNHVVHSNRDVDERIFDEKNCVIKLHGDVSDMLTYRDANGAILTQKQYANSIRQHSSLLTKLEHDSIYENLIYIGCSLDDEIDLLAYTGLQPTKNGITARYYCLTRDPSDLDKIKLGRFGITHCIVFDSYESIYACLYEAGQEALQVRVDDLENYKYFSITKLLDDFEDNKPYLLFGKSLITKDRNICLPYYFISREITKTIVSNLDKAPVQILVGSGCAGKSYVLIDIACKVRDKDVFFFETKDRLTDTAFKSLLTRRSAVVLADNNSLSFSQIEHLFDNIEEIRKNHICFIISANKHDHDISSIIKLRESLGTLRVDSIFQLDISNYLSKKELSLLNPALTSIGAGLFSSNRTIVDNIIHIGKRLEEDSKYKRIKPKLNTVKEIAALIALATEKKVYSHQVIALDLFTEMSVQVKTAQPLIDAEATWSYEKSIGDNSPTKYVINAEYWLYSVLSDFSIKERNKKLVVDAYEYIVKKIVEQYGAPNLFFGNKRSAYREYIRFDNINRIFCQDNKRGKDGLSLIRLIYERLNKMLSVDPNYMHQRAKCFIKSSYYEGTKEVKLRYLDKAFRDANVAEQVFSSRYNECGNERLLISISHVTYTIALIFCHKCKILEYSDVEMNSSAVRGLYEAMKSPYNSYDYARNDSFNYQNVLEQLVRTTISDRTLVSDDCVSLLEELFDIISKQ